MNSDFRNRCDIIIPVWNNLEQTMDCVKSIKKCTVYPFRLVIIDNASGAPTRRYLETLREQGGDRVALIRNEENKGFVKAVNQGMRFSDAPYICIMNNDTIATDGWLKEQIEILCKNDDIGLINPSSNTSCQFPGKLDIDTYAGALKSQKGRYQELYTCRAFAMVLKREIIDKIGYLDDVYGMGYYDDTDYCKRAQQLGYKTVRSKASYVYHKESQSFGKVKEKNDIFSGNEKKFISRWGRQLRVAYVLPGVGASYEIKRISGSINKIAKMGHQVWIFTRPNVKQKLNLIDHESIRFFCYPVLFFSLTVFYKIRKRKMKKKLHVILTNKHYLYKIFVFFGKALEAGIFMDNDFSFIETKLKDISRSSVFK